MSLFEDKQFRKGQGGRPRGVKNKLAHVWLTDVLNEYLGIAPPPEKKNPGQQNITVFRVEDPSGWNKLIASFVPKELEITDSRLHELSDEEIDVLIGEIRARSRGRLLEEPGSGESPTIN